jgi:hypothetical protein
MRVATLHISPSIKTAIWSHLLPRHDESESIEQAAFGFANTISDGELTTFNLVEWLPIDKNSFAHQSGYHIELADEMRPFLIKRAHDLQTSLVEFHSHPFSARAEFSPSDLAGLDEFVPHVWWRLKGRPYLAIVVTPTQFDALAWVTSPRSSAPLQELRAGNTILRPSGLTLRRQRFRK